MPDQFLFRDECVAAVEGRFRLNVYRYGELVEQMDEPNLIVNGSRNILARLLGGDATNRSISIIGFGSNGQAPVAGNTTLTNLFSKTVDAVSYPALGLVQFDFSLLSTEDNGASISEFGLLTTGLTLFARRVRTAPLSKTSAISLTGSWQIAF